MRPARLLALALGGLVGGSLSAQETRPLDRIVAVVGTRVVLASQVEEELVQMQAQGGPVPQDSAGRAAMRRQLVQEMVNDELLVQQAEQDTSVRVTDQEVQEQVAQTVRNVQGQFGSESEFLSQLRMAGFGSVDEWRRRLSEQQRRAILRQRLLEALRQEGKLRPIMPTEQQMREYWEQNKSRLPGRPALVSFRQIVVSPKPDADARVRALQVADSLRGELLRGTDFAAAARRFSADSGTREQGGELGWFRRGVMVKEFEEVAFRLRPGELSVPVETPFGFHLIRVDRVQPAEVFARHILIRPAIRSDQVEGAQRLADSIYSALAAGASFDSLARRFGDPSENARQEDVEVNKLPQEYQQHLAADTTTGLHPVLGLGLGGERPRFVVLEVTGRKGEGPVTFEEVKPRLRESLSQELALQHYLTRLRRQTHVDIRL